MEVEVVAAQALPRWQRLSEGLIRDIAAGRLADGARLPPERAMAEALGVAVGTLRKALADLERKGLLVRRQGSGNYVRHRDGVASAYALFRLERPGGGGLPTADLLGLEVLPKPPGAPPFGPSPLAHRIRRLRRLDGEAVALEEIWLDLQGAALPPGGPSEALYRQLRDRLGLDVVRVEDRVGVAPAPGWGPAAFAPPEGVPVGHVERVGHLAGGGAAEVSWTWFDPARCRYVARQGGPA